MKSMQNHKDQFENFKASQYLNQHQQEWQKIKYYQINKANLKQPEYETLHKLLKGTWNHARRRQNFFTRIDRHPDHTLRCVYSGKILSDAQGKMLEKANEEHSFPQSFQRGSKSGTGRDMHAIFAAENHVNGSRGNIPFGDIGKIVQEDQYGRVYKHEGKRYYCPFINTGAIARASLYILTCYKNCANPQYFPKESLQWMIKEASTQQVSLWEKHRNQQLYKLQGNRNPFIDYPQLALKIDFTEGWQK